MNLFGLNDPPTGQEMAQTLLRHPGARIEVIRSNRASTQWYDQEEDEWVVLLEGEAVLEFTTGHRALKKGESLLIRAHERHRVVQTSADTRWLAIFIPAEGA